MASDCGAWALGSEGFSICGAQTELPRASKEVPRVDTLSDLGAESTVISGDLRDVFYSSLGARCTSVTDHSYRFVREKTNCTPYLILGGFP